MKLSALNALIAAVDEGSLRAAARRLGVSQPAVTKLIRELEQDLGAPVLERSTAGVFPSAQGKVLVEHARRAFRELDDARSLIDQLGGRMIGEISVAAVPYAVLMLVPEAWRTFSRDCPDIQLRLREELYIAQLALLRDGQVDVAIGPIPDGLGAGEFDVEPLRELEMVVVAAPGHPLASARRLPDLAQARWVYTSASGKVGYARNLFESRGLAAPAPAAMVNSTLALLALVARGEHLALMPRPLAEHPSARTHMRVLALEDGPLTMRVGAIVRRSGLLKPAVRHFITHLHRAAQHA